MRRMFRTAAVAVIILAVVGVRTSSAQSAPLMGIIILLLLDDSGDSVGEVPTSRASGVAAITSDGRTVFVANQDSSSVTAIDTRQDTVIREVDVGGEPQTLCLSADELSLFVTTHGENKLVVVDAETLVVSATISVAAEPYGVVVDPHGQRAYVATTAVSAIDVVDLQSNSVVDSIPVAARPKGLTISADGDRLYVTHFLSGQVSVIAPDSASVLNVIATGDDSNMMQKITLHPSNGKAYMPHLRSNVSNPSLLFDDSVFPMVSVIDLATEQHLFAERMDLSVVDRLVNLPFDISFLPDGESMYVLNMGSSDISAIEVGSQDLIAHIDVGDIPRGMVVSPNGLKAYVANALSDDLSVIDLINNVEIDRFTITASPLSADEQLGKKLFFSSRSRSLSLDRWMSCGSCHFDGEGGGRTWLFFAGPRNTTSLRGVSDSRPLHWSADRDEVQDFEFTIRTLQAGTGLVTSGFPNPPLAAANAGLSADLDALAAYVESLQVKNSPFRNADGSLSVAAVAGTLIFERSDTGCSDCHGAPLFTDSSLTAAPFIVHDVGTGGGPDENMGPEFDTPSLRGIRDTAPYLHDGSANTLRDLLVARNPNDQHGQTSQLSSGELDALVAYLQSL